MLNCIKHLLLIIGLISASMALIGQSGFLNIEVVESHPTTCSVKDGSIVITVENGTAPYQYSIDGGTTFSDNNTFNDLGSGSYIAWVTDAAGEFSSFVFVQLIAEGAPQIDGITFENPAMCGMGGRIVVDATGGTPPLAYSIDGGQTFQDEAIFSNVDAGTYDVVVRNADETCPVTHPTVTFTPLEPSRFIDAVINAVEPTCEESTGTITIDIDEEDNPNDFEYSIDRGVTFQANNVFSDLEEGSYSITIRQLSTNCQREIDVITFVVPDCPNPCDINLADTSITLTTCEESFIYCLNITLADTAIYNINLDGQPFTGTFVACEDNASLIGIALTRGRYLVEVFSLDESCEAVAFTTVLCNNEDEEQACDLIQNQSIDLLGDARRRNFCLNFPLEEAFKYDVTLDGISVNQQLIPCRQDPSIAALELGVGTHTIVLTTIGVCQDSVIINITDDYDPTDTMFCNNILMDEMVEVDDPDDIYIHCINIPRSDSANFTFSVNGFPLLPQQIATCPTDSDLLGFALGVGVNMVSFSHSNGICQDSAIITVTTSTEPIDSTFCEAIVEDQEIDLRDENGSAVVCLNIPMSRIDEFDIQINGETPTQSPIGCSANDNNIGYALPTGTYIIRVTHESGTCTDSAVITINEPTLDPTDSLECAMLIEDGSYDLAEEGGTFLFCLNIPQDSLPSFTITVQKEGNSFSPTLDECTENPSFAALVLPQGSYDISLVHDNGICMDMATVIINNPITTFPPCGDIMDETIAVENCDSIITYCLGIPADDVANYEVMVDGEMITNLVPCINDDTLLAIQLGLGIHDIRVMSNGMTCMDSATVTVRCIPPEILIVNDTLNFNQTDSFCIEGDILGGTIVSIENNCLDNAGVIDFLVDTTTLCIIYSSSDEDGQGQACIVVCNDAGMCGTVNINITVLPETVTNFSDTVNLNETDTFCIDTTQLSGTITSIMNTCPNESGESVVFEIDSVNYCVIYTGMEVGTEEACIRICDDTGRCFTTEITITVEDERLTFDTTINVGERDTFCIDTTLVVGAIESIRNICPEESGEFVSFEVDSVNYCVIFEGLAEGTESACIEVCSVNDDCVVIDVTINVVEDSLRPPIAVPDQDTVDAGSSVVINVLDNDTLFSADIRVDVVVVPANGEAVVNADGTITYTPNPNFCDLEDMFIYRVCNMMNCDTDGCDTDGCDTARVTIFVECVMLEILDGFSPNGDGINDTFTINGINAFPNNHLQIFDRRGARVFEANNYQNDWDGTWDGNDLPDGTYYYMLDDGQGNIFTGYLVLRR